MRVWVAVAVALVLLGMGASYYYIEEKHPVSAGTALASSVPEPAAKGRFSVLILGVDERAGDNGRSDTIMLAAVDLDADQVRLLSFPRDTFVNIPGHGFDKANHAYAFGKEKLAIQTIEGFTGMPLDHYVIINMNGFKQVVEALGGVTVDIDKDMDYDDPYDEPPLHIHLKKGTQKLDPTQAMGFVRFRHDADGDYGRSRRQQQMLKALAAEALKPSNLLKLPQVISAAYGAVRSDLSSSQALQLGLLVKNWSSGGVLTEGTPAGEDYWHEGVAYIKLDLVTLRTQVYKMLKGEEPPAEFLALARKDAQGYETAFVPDKPAPMPGAGGTRPGATPPTPAQPAPAPAPQPAPRTQWNVSLVDASGKGAAVQAISALNTAGLRVVSAAKTRTPMPETLVILHVEDATLRQHLQAIFPKARFIFQPANRDTEAPVEIILGADVGAASPTPGPN